MSTLKLENIGHPDAAGNALEFGADGSITNNVVISGNVGIGSSTVPSKPLVITSSVNNLFGTQLVIESTTESAGIQLNPVGSAHVYEMQANSSNDWFVYNRTNEQYALKINGNSHVTKPYQPGFYARRSIGGDGRSTGAQEWTVSGAGSYNTGNHFDTSNGRFTAPINGKYMFAAAPGYKQSSIDFNFYFRINGTDAAEPVRFIGALNSHSLACGTIIVNLSAGDYVQVHVGFTHHVNTVFNYFCGYLVG